jgi:hypothetical protein
MIQSKIELIHRTVYQCCNSAEAQSIIDKLGFPTSFYKEFPFIYLEYDTVEAGKFYPI